MFKPIREIRSKEGVLHFRRWRIIETRWGNIYLHHIAKSDEDKHQHDHPWDFTSLILKGGYIERAFTAEGVPLGYESTKTCTPGKVVKHKAEDTHKIELLAPTWTLVFTGPRRREWGYQTEEGWKSNEEYRKWKRDGRITR